ncbi:YjfB family protein [Planomicrobium sp. MB-3u-38]|uniref:YjfB family protein n=1 Tax=Planomicrobium sp. MB-3u-38 TaxID=2058318 RepID=UPI000C7B95C8|nr:YjfB family protein [Planomicrobium sp. MB-3u-38]PKH10365.1 putative motility protein [Planomicrobium sp. MB-3u-38]
MDVTTYVTAAAIMTSQSSVQQNVNIALLKKAMNTSESNSNELIRTMQHSVQPHMGSKVDIKG